MAQEKDYSTLRVELSEAIYEQLEAFCKEQNLSESEAVEKIMESVLTKHFSGDDSSELR